MSIPHPVPVSSNPGLLGAQSPRDFLIMLYGLLPILQVIVMGYGVLNDDEVFFIIGAVGAVIQLILQFARTQDFLRKVIYTVLLTINAGLAIWVAGWGPDTLETWMPLISAVVGGTPALFAAQNVNGTGDPSNPIVPGEVTAVQDTLYDDGAGL